MSDRRRAKRLRVDAPIHRRHDADYMAWWAKVVGQIHCTVAEHPEYFTEDEKLKSAMVRSLAKRIVGEIVAGGMVGDDAARGGSTCGARAKGG